MQLAQASSCGAKGVVLSFGVLGDRLESMIAAAADYGLESVVEVRSRVELEALKASTFVAQCRMVALAGMSVDDAIVVLKGGLVPEGALKVVFLPVYADKQLIEAEDAWRLRDAGANAIWASEVLFKFGVADGEHASSVIRAIKVRYSDRTCFGC